MKLNEFRVLFIYPNFPLSNMLLPAGVSILSAFLKQEGIKTKLFDTTFYGGQNETFDDYRESIHQLKTSKLEAFSPAKNSSAMQDFKDLLDEFKPNLIGMSVLQDTLSIGLDFAQEAHRRKIPVLAGGIYPTFSPEDVIKEDCIDMVCVGEGEKALLELCKAMAAGESYEQTPNLWVKRADGEIIKNPLGSLVNVNELPYPDYRLFESERMFRPMQGKVLRILPIEMHRGCPYKCTFCEDPSLNVLYKAIGENYHRAKSPRRLIDEIKYFVEEFEANYIYFNAETFFAMPTKDFYELAELYPKEVGLPFWLQTRPETITEERVRILKDMNVSNINIGLEHGNEEFRSRVLKRRMSNTRILASLKLLNEADVPVTVNNIMGYPDETRELIFDTIELNRSVKSATMNAYLYNPYKGTELYDVCKAKGYLPKEGEGQVADISLSTEAFAYFKTVLTMPTISKEELMGLQKTFVLYAKLPRSEFPRIKIAEKNSDEGRKVFQELSEEFHDMIIGINQEEPEVKEYLSA
jgi:anaerobic magnesium-protoporphyrin IX monomethyl ester cyclase